MFVFYELLHVVEELKHCSQIKENSLNKTTQFYPKIPDKKNAYQQKPAADNIKPT